MRIWSIHPKYLDAKGIVALWRETLLAKHVLEGSTKGYRSHPQLTRFKNHEFTLAAIHYYLAEVYEEAVLRGYRFSAAKFERPSAAIPRIPVQMGQIEYERHHLLEKLKQRDPGVHDRWQAEEHWELHPLFERKDGGIEHWERV